VVAVAAAIQIGGPGTIVWIWITSIIGALIKYAEVVIGMKRRRLLADGSYAGGPMYFLQDAFGVSWPAIIFCVLMCLYGVEVYQFGVVTSVTSNLFGVSKIVASIVFFAIVVIVEKGGFRRVGRIATLVLPFGVLLYFFMGLYVLIVNFSALPGVFADVLSSAFTSRAAEGAFVGSSLLLTISHGVRRGCYSSDIGVGYASMIHSKSVTTHPDRQASLLIFEVFTDTILLCSMSVFLVLVTGTWKETLDPMLLVQTSLGKYFPHMDIFMPLFIALLGYATTSTYFSAGMHTVKFLMPVWGRTLLYVYSVVIFSLFTFVDNNRAISLMSVIGFLLLLCNAAGIWRMRRLVSFDVTGVSERQVAQVALQESS
jgi:AGCS family alanine or glycine:cation symporter